MQSLSIVKWIAGLPITKRLMDSLYVAQCSPIASLSAVYNGSRSMRAGTWLLLDTLGALCADALIVFGGRIGVVEMIEGRLNAAGSMSGILRVAPGAAFTVRLAK
jgi:hypothetical protein